jgi:hypothetical protein
MPARQPHVVVASAARPLAAVTVCVMVGRHRPASGISQALPHWRRLTPLATWAPINLRGTDRAEILEAVNAVLERHIIPTRRLILLGEGAAARHALELVLQGELACAGLLAIGVSCDALPFPITSTAAAIRLVVDRQGCEAPSDLIDALRAADIDERVIRLNAAGADAPRVAADAAETFVLELVATVGHQARHGVRR